MQKAIFCGMLFYCCFMYSISSISETYNQLKKNPRYKKMSGFEIAIDRGDFEAMRYFEFRTSDKKDLEHTRVLLQNKIAAIESELADQKRDFLTQPEKGERLTEVEKTRDLIKTYESLLHDVIRRIEGK